MTHKERVLAYLRTIAPAGATNGQITRELGIRSPSITYLLTQGLMYKSLIRGELAKGAWTFYALKTAGSEFGPIASYSWELVRAERAWQVRWIVPLLEGAEGRAWFLREALRCPCPPDEAAGAEAFHFCRPLGDLFDADYARVLGKPALEEAFIAYYNRLFGLGEGPALSEVWRSAPGGALRHPAGRPGWDNATLRHLADKAQRRRAGMVARTLETEADLLLLSARHAVIVECCVLRAFSGKRYKRLLRMSEVLARRLNRSLHLGLLVDDDYQPPFEWKGLPYVRGSEIVERSAR